MQTIQQSIEQLRDALCDYIEATYHIGAGSLIARRKALLEQPGVIHQVPYLESTPRYEAGQRFADMAGLSSAAREVYQAVSRAQDNLSRLVYDPPYQHQAEAVQGSLIDDQNLIIMTGTGSGKTESFLLPILGKLAREAKERPNTFGARSAMRALVLYPMNALVNDQLGRLRTLFGDPRIVSLFKGWAGRPVRFARYTSRTPYAGLRTAKKDSAKLRSLAEFYVDIERRARKGEPEERAEARRLLEALRERGKWPGKPNLAAWLGEKGGRWQNPQTGAFVRAVTLPDDTELLTRHEVQAAPADLVVTNYSMLEYMMMRPMERPIFDMTRAFLEDNREETFLVVLDEAHLYRGAAGAEVGLLLRRLRDRLGISAARFRVICATASFGDRVHAPLFGGQISGLPVESFRVISGTLALRPEDDVGSRQDADILAGVNLRKYYEALTDGERLSAIKPLLNYRGVDDEKGPEEALYRALVAFPPMGRLINMTMKRAVPMADVGKALFPGVEAGKANAAANGLMALGSVARKDARVPGLLPCRVHSFFRGLAGLWVCMDADCVALDDTVRDGICGRMYSQPRDCCECGARVLELYTCRNCGAAYARAYTDDVDVPGALWGEAGGRLRLAEGETVPLVPLDLLLEDPALEDIAESADYDLETGRINPRSPGRRTRRVHIRSDRVSDGVDEDEASSVVLDSRGQFSPCAVCGKRARFGRSYVQNHQTKGDQPFQALVASQLEVQPPSAVKATSFAPLQGRKVLTFSDSRQVAARLAPNLQMYSTRDSLRPLIAWGYRRLQGATVLRRHLSLEDLYLAVLLASNGLNVRLRPEVKSGETFAADQTVREAIAKGAADDDAGLLDLSMEIRNARPPEALLDQIVATVQDRFLGLEALGLASIAERCKHTGVLGQLPVIAGVVETSGAKVDLARAWLRCWQSHGFWLSSMPPVWWRRPRAEGTSIGGQRGWFKAMDGVLRDGAARKAFRERWLPTLLSLFTEEVDGGVRRLRGNEITLLFDGAWAHCTRCKSVHRPVAGIYHCLDCGGQHTRALSPDEDSVFLARKGFYRNSVTAALSEPPRRPMALVAAEHTAQLNAPQNEDVFSKAEENELLFQDIAINRGGSRGTAIDVLSSTTTMEVGIDIGALSGVALRNMPPSRANYQQRSGRAGRRGNAVATVVAFGSADSHDEHYFMEPDAMIRGDVVDPSLTLDNAEIVRRHVRAYLLQSYHQDRIPTIDPGQPHDLFSVLGTVSGFRSGTSILNRDDFAAWLAAHGERLRDSVASWIPQELDHGARDRLLTELEEDCIRAVDDAIGHGSAGAESLNESDEGQEEEVAEEEGEEVAWRHGGTERLLDRLLYCGKLPRYAFPTDVATFHVFDLGRSSRFRPIMRFAPQQGLSVALTQYAPGKQVWISGKCYTSGAVYSVNRDDRYAAWRSKRIYMECRGCGFACTYPIGEAARGETRDCQACGGEETFGPGRYWLRPPGFAHPVDAEEVTSPDDMPEISYATRAKLTMDTPRDGAAWVAVNERTRVLPSRQHLLVSNTGPRTEGYTYCVTCGRIEASTERSPKVTIPHLKPYPDDDDKRSCDGGHTSRHIVLGTDFITDIALFSMRVAAPLSLKPGHTSTAVALRTLSEALAKAACQLLEVEADELMAEYRPALTPAGKSGLEAEIFLYDTLPGGAGFSTELAKRGAEVFRAALSVLSTCPEDCDSSCYRCLRSFKNRLEHGLLDRHVGAQLLAYLLSGELREFSQERLRASTGLLYYDLLRQAPRGVEFVRDAVVGGGPAALTAPILAQVAGGRQYIIALSAPLAPSQPADPLVASVSGDRVIPIIVENELVVRGNLAAATGRVIRQVEGSS